MSNICSLLHSQKFSLESFHSVCLSGCRCAPPGIPTRQEVVTVLLEVMVGESADQSFSVRHQTILTSKPLDLTRGF